MNYQKAVIEAKQLVKRSEEDQWRLSELTAEVIAEGRSGAQWARDIGVHPSYATRLRQVWERFGDDRHRPRFADAYGTVSIGSEELVSAGEARSLQAQRQIPTRHEDKVEMARKLLSEPRVVKAVLREPVAREPILDALAQPTSSSPAREPRPRDSNIAAMAQIARAHDLLEAANRTVEADELTEEQRTKAEVMLRALESEIGVWRVNVGGQISDEAIARFMAESG